MYRQYYKRLIGEKFSPKFLLSRLLLRTKTDVHVPIVLAAYPFAKVYLHAASIAHNLWLKNYDIACDIAVFKKFIKPHNTVIDVGSNIGHLSIIAGILAQDGDVISIEPAMRTYRYLLENIALNNLQNVLPLQIAVSQQNGVRDFYEFNYSDEQNSFNPALFKLQQWSNVKRKTIACRLDALLSLLKMNTVDFLKIDTEGAELEVIQSLGKFISRVSIIYFEFYEENFKNFHYKGMQLLNFLKENHFEIFKPRFQNQMLHIMPYNETVNAKLENLLAINQHYANGQ